MVYLHTQTTSSTSWVIAHNLNQTSVAVDVMIDNGGNLEKVLPLGVVHTDNNTLTVTFSSAQTGNATVAA